MANDDIWGRGYKIPWDEPGFSRRMLGEHLSQAHDMASRRVEWIDRQVEWIHKEVLGGQPAAILDLGCGPGFYAHRLAALGHHCRGIDFGPASIEYARENNCAAARCEFVRGDIRECAFGGPYDLAMILFGEMNVFAPAEILGIVQRVHASLAARRGTLILEVQTPEAVERAGRNEAYEEECSSGLFSDRPYVCRADSRWLAEDQVAIETFTIQDAAGGEAQLYRSTTRAWSAGELTALLEGAGFGGVARQTTWPCNVDSLELWRAAAG